MEQSQSNNQVKKNLIQLLAEFFANFDGRIYLADDHQEQSTTQQIEHFTIKLPLSNFCSKEIIKTIKVNKKSTIFNMRRKVRDKFNLKFEDFEFVLG